MKNLYHIRSKTVYRRWYDSWLGMTFICDKIEILFVATVEIIPEARFVILPRSRSPPVLGGVQVTAAASSLPTER